MVDRIAHIDKSIEKWYYPAAINQIKHSILYENITKDTIEELNIKLLSCLESENFDSHKKIKEIQKIINNTDFCNKLNNDHKSKLYISLWDNLFDLWEMSDALIAYQERANLWDKDALKVVIYMSIYMYFSLKKDNVSVQDTISHLIEEIEKQENLMKCIPNIKNDLLRFFYSEIVVENPGDNLMMHLYNLEAREIVTRQQFSILSSTLWKEEFENRASFLVLELEDEYDILFSEYSDKNILIAKENMKSRMMWKQINFSEFWAYIKEFILIWLGLADKYALLNNKIDTEKSLFIIDFLISYGIKNLNFQERSYLIHYFHEFILKNEHLNDSYLDWIKKILFKNIDWEVMTANDLVLLWDIFLKLWEYGNVIKNYLLLINMGFDLSSKIKILLEDILLNKEFFKPSEFESNFWILEWRKMFDFKRTKMEPELAISLLLEKIELWKALTEEDYENIEELCISN